MAKGTGRSVAGDELVAEAYSLFDEFRTAYEPEWTRQKECERLYRAEHWEDMQTDSGKPKPTTPVLHSSVENIAADVMDKYPEAIIRPETPQDMQIAQIVGALIRQNHDASAYGREYKRLAHDLLVCGYCVQEVGYDPFANRNIGAAFIRQIGVENIMFDPQVTDLQDGRAVFMFQPKTIKWLEKRYPEHVGEFAKDSYQIEGDGTIKFDKDKSIFLIEYWWREYDAEAELWRVHMAKMAGRQLLEDSRDEKPDGYFAFGEYPFLITTLFERKGSCLGIGLCDIFGNSQKYSDKLDQLALGNASLASSNKLLVTKASGFDAGDLADWSKQVHVGDSLNGVTWFGTPPLPQYTIAMAGQIRESIKEESGANDVSRGNIASGVTAASAIAALQEMSGKRSRMMVRSLHESFREAVRMEIEIEREYNDLPRQVLVTDENGQQVQATFESALLSRKSELGNDVPIEFFVSIKVQQENRWTIQAHNDLIIQMVQLGIAAPQQALELMEFEGKDTLLSKMRQQPQGQTPEETAMQQQAGEEEELMRQAQQVPPPEQAAGAAQAAQPTPAALS